MQLSEDEMRNKLYEATVAAGSMRKFARSAGISASYVSQVLLGKIPVSDRLASTLGYEMKTVYERTAEDSAPAQAAAQSSLWRGRMKSALAR